MGSDLRGSPSSEPQDILDKRNQHASRDREPALTRADETIQGFQGSEPIHIEDRFAGMLKKGQ